MRKNSNSLLALTAFAALIVLPAKLLAIDLECSVVFQPDELLSQSGSVDLQVLFPGQVGDPLRGNAEEESGIDVLDVDTEASGVTVVTVDTSDAVSGEWMIHFEAEEGACRGRLTIAE